MDWQLRHNLPRAQSRLCQPASVTTCLVIAQHQHPIACRSTPRQAGVTAVDAETPAHRIRNIKLAIVVQLAGGWTTCFGRQLDANCCMNSQFWHYFCCCVEKLLPGVAMAVAELASA